MAQQMETTTSIYNTDSIIDEDNTNGACVDSGYSSLGSLTHVSPINGSSLRPSVSHYLQPIYENEQINSFTASELTPTSQSIRRISEFHITSPISSLKRSATPSLPSTPIKFGSPKKMRLDGKRKAHLNLIDNIHVDENSENRDIGNFEFSPIKAANVLQNRNGKFERKGSFSSTPIYEESLLKSLSVSKTDFFTSANRKNQTSLVIRKTKSFSPSKHSLLVQRNRHIPVQTTKPIPEDKELPCTPARKSFKRMLCRQDALESSPQPSCSNLFDTTATDSFNESDITLESPLIFKSPSPSPPQPTSSSGTPIKKIRRNLSFNLAQPSPKKELDKIIFSKIPCSPRKLRAPATKRSSTTKDVAVVAKRPQLDLSPLLPKRASYAHLKHFDIFSHLAETTTAIQKILSYVEPKDIYHMYNVCQQWRTIIKNDTFASDQRSKFHRSLARNKENLQRKPLLRSRTMIPKSPVSRSPLKRANSVNVRKNSLRKMPTQSSFDEETLLVSTEFCWQFFFVASHEVPLIFLT